MYLDTVPKKYSWIFGGKLELAFKRALEQLNLMKVV